ncbi:ABC transporter ATP-binding protein [Cognatishimia sp. MH4019]|uniref:ABC transporter ATP-binding protein n=1 Tax=Cognatishimia sp. MH4019 TaxID=2854030 RepID=UPI001CD2C91E|nr:ABC transporter ATP-binding protein [Cognatishimia sp. MH4019]
MTAAIEISGLRKIYPGSPPVQALRHADLTIQDNEFFTLLGPSGCGKTTLLRLIAGFEIPTAGALNLFGEDISYLPPERRPINTVFQHYSLFPHMTVLDNVAFGLKRLRKSDAEAKKVAQEMLDLVHLAEFGSRKPSQLSGGQQQRVALARALAPHPRVLLLDEPLSALDLKLRQSMRTELKRLQKETGITFVFVTHDQEEALAMSDRVAVMSQGEIQQIGEPATIYEYPENKFVAEFIGDANFFHAKVLGGTNYGLPNGETLVGPDIGAEVGSTVTLFFRPEKINLRTSGSGLAGTVSEILYLGNSTDYLIELTQGGTTTVRSENHKDGTALAEVGADVRVDINPAAVRVLIK